MTDDMHDTTPVLPVPFEAVKSGVDAYHKYRRDQRRQPNIITDGEVTAIIRAAMPHLRQDDPDGSYYPFGRLDPDNPIDQAIVEAFNRKRPESVCALCEYPATVDHHRYTSAKGYHSFQKASDG